MKAAVYERYGAPEVLALKEVPVPTPAPSEILVEIHATTVTSGDWRVRSLHLPPGFGLFGRLAFGLLRPRQPVLGTELAGKVVAIGERVTKFAVGDAVIAFPGAKMGCYAEYRCIPEDGPIVPKPANLSYDEAAALSFGGTTALSFLRRANVQRGERVLVVGASGCVGSAAIQLAKHLGAEVTGVCSTANVALVRSLGADHVIDYTKQDFTQTNETYDVILDTTNTAGWSRSKRSLRDHGRLLVVLGGLWSLLQAPFVSLTTNKRVIAGPAPERVEDLRELAHLAESGIYRPVVDRRYPFAQIVEAHRYVDTGRKRGNVVMTLIPT
jgi:NADPH:quinone reductase-like Zn-dependent oxidoreductase